MRMVCLATLLVAILCTLPVRAQIEIPLNGITPPIEGPAPVPAAEGYARPVAETASTSEVAAPVTTASPAPAPPITSALNQSFRVDVTVKSAPPPIVKVPVIKYRTRAVPGLTKFVPAPAVKPQVIVINTPAPAATPTAGTTPATKPEGGNPMTAIWVLIGLGLVVGLAITLSVLPHIRELKKLENEEKQMRDSAERREVREAAERADHLALAQTLIAKQFGPSENGLTENSATINGVGIVSNRCDNRSHPGTLDLAGSARRQAAADEGIQEVHVHSNPAPQ